MNEELTKLIEALKGVPADAREAFVEAMQKEAGDLYLAVFNRGHATATAQNKTKLETVTLERDNFGKRIKELEGQLEEVRTQGDNPDLEKLREEYQSKLQALVDDNAKLTQQLEQKDADHIKSLESVNADFTLANVRSRLLGVHGVEDLIADSIITKPDLRKRLTTDETGKVIGLLQEDGITPMPIPQGHSVVDVLADAEAHKVPDRYKADPRQRSTRPGTPAPLGSRKPTFTREDLSKMSPDEYAKNRDAVREAVSEGRVAAQ